jgi:hypothetical protein
MAQARSRAGFEHEIDRRLSGTPHAGKATGP